MRYSGTDCALMCTAVPQKDTKVGLFCLPHLQLNLVLKTILRLFALSEKFRHLRCPLIKSQPNGNQEKVVLIAFFF